MKRGTPIPGRNQPSHPTIPASTTTGIDHRGVARAVARELNRARPDVQWTVASRPGIFTSTLDTNQAGIRLGRTLRQLGCGALDAACIHRVAEAHRWTGAFAERSPSHARVEVEP
jgi:hypothetical protein